MSDLAEYLKRGLVPSEGEPPVMPYARAFGAGLVDPMGLPSGLAAEWAHRLPIEPGTLDWYKRRMQEARDESPTMAGAGSAIVPGLLLSRLAAPLGVSAGALMPHLINMGVAFGGLRGALAEPPSRPRPQSAYPPGGAY